jgi:hypothetical protein
MSRTDQKGVLSVKGFKTAEMRDWLEEAILNCTAYAKSHDITLRNPLRLWFVQRLFRLVAHQRQISKVLEGMDRW